MSSNDQILYLLKSRGAQTTDTIVGDVGISDVGARKQLTRLADQGLVQFVDRHSNVGRPKRTWSLTVDGHGRFPNTHSDLTVELLRSAREVFGDTGVEHLISARERQSLVKYQAALEPFENLEKRVHALCDLRCREGYMAEVEVLGSNAFKLLENHCPICVAASECQGLCRSELDLFTQALGPGVEVSRTEHLLSGARRCAYRIEASGG